jgi:hypothetical protein
MRGRTAGLQSRRRHDEADDDHVLNSVKPECCDAIQSNFESTFSYPVVGFGSKQHPCLGLHFPSQAREVWVGGDPSITVADPRICSIAGISGIET